MKLVLNKNDFINVLLGPVSKLADNLVLDFEQDGEKTITKTLVTSSDNSVILLGRVNCKTVDHFKCIIPDCKTFLRLFSGIEKDNIGLTVDSNVICYKDSGFSFKYHLLDESYVSNKKSISEEKLNSLSYDSSFRMTKQKLSEIIKFNSIVPDAEKLYFFTEGSKVFAKLGDEQKSNTNEIVTEICDCFNGQEFVAGLPINIQNILLFSFSSDEIVIKINHELKVFKFESPSLSYIVSGLVK